jgi:hypothetical protein|tara:strand:- start:1365 stop:1856 length:492 start_codon:yes stop_codon:yes gene_type:complete
MTKVFKKQEEVMLQPSGFISDIKESPITNPDFVRLQKKADYIVRLAEKMKDKDFKGKEAVQMSDIVNELTAEMNNESVVEFIASPKEPKSPTLDKLSKEALSFLDFHDEKSNVSKINEYLQEFAPINEFETFGLFFEPGIAKLNKIYTIKEITAATQVMLSQL